MNFDVEHLTHNLRVYGWIRMLMMRVYLPLIAVYLVEVGNLSLQQIGLLGTVAAIVSLLANIPTGYLADKWTRKTAIIVGAILLAVGSLAYALLPGFHGAMLAVVVESLGYSVISGAGEAMMHDSLCAMGKTDDYVRVIGRAQSFALTGNIILVGLVPLTYGFNKRLPFLLGAVAALVFLSIATTLVEPPRPPGRTTDQPHNLLRVLRVFVHRRTILFFIALGLLSSAYKAFPPFTNLAMVDLGFSPGLLGIMFAAASVLGAINGRFVHHFKRFTLLQYSLFDVSVAASFLLVIGLTRNLAVAIVAFIINLGFWRIRSIMYQDQLLRRFGNHHHKATLISTIGFFDSINFWQGPLFAAAVGWVGYYRGFTLIGASMLVVLGALFAIATYVFDRPAKPTN